MAGKSNLIFFAQLFPCGRPKKSPCTSSIEQIIFYFWSFEISEGILRNEYRLSHVLDYFSVFDPTVRALL